MFIITVLLAILGLIGTDVFVPSLPHIAAMYHLTPNQSQLTITVFLIGFAVSQIFYGPISDYTGRKFPLILGLIIFIMGSLLCCLGTTFELLLLGRVIQGIGVGAGLSLARVIIRDSYEGKLLAVRSSQIGMFVSLTPPLAPLLGGFLQDHFGARASFIFMLVYGCVLLFLLMFCFKETIKTKDKTLTVRSTLGHYHALIQNVSFIRYAIIAGLAFAAIILYANVIPFIIQDQLHLSAFANGVILLLGALGISFGSLLSSRLVENVSPLQLVLSGLNLFILGGLVLLISELLIGINIFCLVPSIFIISLACGFIFPNAIALCFAEVSCNIGIVGALYGSMQMLTSMLINLILNIISHQSQAMLGIFYIVIGLSGLVISYQSKKLVQNVQPISHNRAATPCS